MPKAASRSRQLSNRNSRSSGSSAGEKPPAPKRLHQEGGKTVLADQRIVRRIAKARTYWLALRCTGSV